MALAPVQLISDFMEDYPNYWLKMYEQGTTTPIVMAINKSGTPTVAKAEISAGPTPALGLIKTAGNVTFIPYVDEAYDAYIFPTEAEADANDTANAIQLADDVDFLQEIKNATGGILVAAAVADADLNIGDFVDTVGHTVVGKGANTYEVVAGGTGTDDNGSFIDMDNGNQLKGTFPTGDYNIYQWGAAGDNTDDQAAFEGMFGFMAVTGGGHLHFPPGTFAKSDTITIFPKTRITQHPDAPITSFSAHNPMFLNGIKGNVYTNYGAHGDITWDGGFISPRSSVLIGTSVNIFSIGHGKNIRLRNITMTDLESFHFIEFNAVDGGWIEDCVCEEFIDGGSRAFSEAIQLDFMGSQTQFGSFGIGSFDNTPCKNITISGCKMKNVGRGVGSHSFDNVTETIIESVEIRDLQIENVLTSLVKADGWKNFNIRSVINLGTVPESCIQVDDCTDASISNCQTGTSTQNGILVRTQKFGAVSDINITDNIILGAADAIDVQSGNRINISDNTIESATANGIKIQTGTLQDGGGARTNESIRVAVQGNIINGVTGNAIEIKGTTNLLPATGIIVQDNVAANSGATAIILTDTDFSMVQGNHVTSPTTNGILLISTTLQPSNIVSDNHVIANGADGIQLVFQSAATVTGNFTRAAADGIKIGEGCTEVLVASNHSNLYTGWGFRAITNSTQISFVSNNAKVSGAASGGLEFSGSVSDCYANGNDFKASGTTLIAPGTGNNVVSGGNNV